MCTVPMSSVSKNSYIYADNAATTQLSVMAYASMTSFLVDEYGNPSQPYAFSRPVKRALREARESIASCINADPGEIVFTSGGTESDNWAIKGFALRDDMMREIVTSEIEHHAVLDSCKAMSAIGHRVAVLPVSRTGVIALDALREMSLGDGSLVSCMYANNEIGTIQPIGELCDIAHSKGAIFHTDAVQAVGHVEIDVKAMGVDMLSASAHKFNGPKGIGFLYIKDGTPLAPYANGGAQEMGRRAGTENVASIVAMAVALKENCDAIEANAVRLGRLERLLLDDLAALGVPYRRNGENQLPGLMSLSFAGASGEMLLHRLDLMKIAVSTGSACDGANTRVSHVLKAIGLPEAEAKETVRISLGKHNGEGDVRAIATALGKILLRD